MLIALLLAQSALPDPSAPVPPIIRSLMINAGDCVHNQAKRLATSGDPPNDIATAAISECEPSIADVREAVSKAYSPDMGEAVDKKFRARVRSEAVSVVVETKAAHR